MTRRSPCLRRANGFLRLRRGRQARPLFGSGSQRGWWLAVGAYAALVLALSVIPVGPYPPVDHLDKVVHLGKYLILAWLLVQAVRAGRLEEREYLFLAWIYATSYGLLIEVVQGMLPWRSAEVMDAVMNGVGAALGVWLGHHIPRRL